MTHLRYSLVGDEMDAPSPVDCCVSSTRGPLTWGVVRRFSLVAGETGSIRIVKSTGWPLEVDGAYDDCSSGAAVGDVGLAFW